jgi:hypothetical protein
MALLITSENALNQVATPALPLATDEYSRQYQDQLNSVLRLYFNRINALQQQLDWAQPVDYIDFNTTPGVFPHQTGRVNWNPTDAALEVDLEYGVVQQVGQELYARVRNSTGVTIPNGTVVGFSGATNDAIQAVPYLADGTQSTLYALGVMTHDLPDSGQKGYCTTLGFVREVDTSAFTQGDVLYASPTTAGAFTNVKPTAPNSVVSLGLVMQVSSTDGVIFVRPVIEQQKAYGTFSRNTNYSPAVINTPYAIEFGGAVLSNGVTIGTPASRIVTAGSGFYSVSASLQYSSSNAAAKNIYSWVRRNGVDVVDSSRVIGITGNNVYTSVFVAESVSMNAGDYIEVMFAVTDTSVTLAAVPATAFAPNSPAANLVIQQIQL